MVIWPYHVILFIIRSNNIPLNLPMVLIYHLVFNSSLFQYTKPHSSIIENWFSFIVLLKCTSPLLHFWEVHQLVILTIILLFSHLLGNNLPSFDFIQELDLFLYLYNCKSISKSFYRSISAKSIALHKTWNLWNYHIGSECTAC